MTTTYFMGDAHLGHKNIHTYRGMESSEEHDALIKENYHSVVSKRDHVIFMGDTCFTKAALDELATWPAQKKTLILGNHDLERDVTMRDLLAVYDSIHGFKKYKGFWLSHAPIHPDELRGKCNIHGHVHSKSVNDHRYYNTSMENIDMKPISIDVLRQRLYSRPEFGFTKQEIESEGV